jgi:hypothetical protein
MNKIIYEIGADGSVITLPSNSSSGSSQIELEPLPSDLLNESTDISDSNSDPGNFKKAKQFMRTPCGHRYHAVCLKKWMERKLECPFCR